MEEFKIYGNNSAVNQPHTGLLRRIGVAVARAFDAFNEPKPIPVPPGKYVPDREFVENFCARHGVRGGINTQGDHDKLIDSLRNYNFSDATIAETRLNLKADAFWNTDLPAPRGMDPNYHQDGRRTKDEFIV